MKVFSVFNVFKKPVVIVITLTVLAVVLLSFGGGNDLSRFDFIVAEKGEIRDEVSVTGKVKPTNRADLAFEKTGRVAYVGVRVGEKVVSGQQLLMLEGADVSADLLKAEAQLTSEEVLLEELVRGTREGEIRVQEVKVSNAKTALEDARQSLVDTIKDAYTKADDAVRNKVDQFFSNPRSNNPQLDFIVKDSQLEINVESRRVNIETLLVSWKNIVDILDTTSDLSYYINTVRQNLQEIKLFLSDVSLVVNDLNVTTGLTQATIDGYKNDVSTARTNANTATANISSADEKVRSGNSVLLLAREELSLKKAGATEEELRRQEAKVEEARAQVARSRADLAKTTLHAPFSGVVTAQNTARGEIVTANTIVVSIISGNEFEINTNIPEADIARVSNGDTARVTLDAYGSGVEFKAHVTAIDPAETVIEGVSTYKTTLQFEAKDSRIRSGMTANIDIVANSKNNVISVPQRAVIKNKDSDAVRIIGLGGVVKEVSVTTGLRGSNGMIEVVKGIKEGDKVIIFERTE